MSGASPHRLITHLAIVVLLAIAWPPTTFAYSCSGRADCAVPGPGDVIFTGVVLRQGAEARSDEEPARPTLFRVLESFHGLDPGVPEVELWSQYFEELAPGSRWVIDAVRSSVDGVERIDDRQCGRSGRLDDPDPGRRESGEAFLKRLVERRDGTASTTVRVFRHASTLSGVDRVGQIDLILRNAGRTFQISVPDDDLILEREVEPGQYEVEVVGGELPFLGLREGGFTAHAGSCNNLLLEFGRRTRISGAVAMPDGGPARETEVSIQRFPPGDDGDETTLTDAEGRYDFRGMTAGEYTVFASRYGFRETFYPGTSSVTSGGAIRVGDPGDVKNIDIRLAAKLPLAEVTLFVTNMVGQPAASVPISVTVREFFEGQETSGASIGETDYKGRFIITSKIGAFLEVRANVGPAAAISSSSSEPLETGRSSFRVVESAQIEKLPLVDRFCQVSLLKWEPCAEKAAGPDNRP